MDLNMVVLNGRLIAPPDFRILDSGTRLARLLVAIRSEHPHERLDVVPFTWWEPDDEFIAAPPPLRRRLWITGSVQRRFSEAPGGRRSKLEVVAAHVAVLGGEDCDELAAGTADGP